MGDNNQFTRRGFIAGGTLIGASALLPTPVERLLNALTTGVIQKAEAQASGNEGARNYINIYTPGGPIRYAFDHWMRTSTSDPNLIFNPMVATKFISSGGRVTGVECSTFNYRNVLVPHMFSHSVFNSAGAQRPLTDLLDNMLVIRGYGTGFDGHPFNAAVQQAPIGGVSSVAGLVADYSSKTFEAVEWPGRGAAGNYNSVKGRALNLLGGAAPLNSLLEGFGAPEKNREKGRSLKDRNREAYDLAQARLRAYAQSEYAGSSIVGKNLSNAMDLMKKGIGNIDGYWSEAVARYKNVVKKSMTQSGLVGLNDASLISDRSQLWNVTVPKDGGLSALNLSSNFDLRSSIANITVPDLFCEGLALAEYVLKEGLVSSLNILMAGFSNLFLKEATTETDGGYPFIGDMHLTGAFPSLYLSAIYFRAFSAGVLELADQLKKTQVNGTDLWSETVVQLISEFDRSARSDGFGSDHGFNQMVTSVYSGAIKEGPFVVGNISLSGLNTNSYSGTQGIGAGIDGYNQSGRPTPAMAASTVAALLRVEKNPYQNIAAPLVELNNGALQVLKTAKITG